VRSAVPLHGALERLLGVLPGEGVARGAGTVGSSRRALAARVGAGDQLVGDFGEPGQGERLRSEDLVGDHVVERLGEPLVGMALKQRPGCGQPA
jgi:hypothetical protein